MEVKQISNSPDVLIFDKGSALNTLDLTCGAANETEQYEQAKPAIQLDSITAELLMDET
jgi:hypothetical protein